MGATLEHRVATTCNEKARYTLPHSPFPVANCSLYGTHTPDYFSLLCSAICSALWRTKLRAEVATVVQVRQKHRPLSRCIVPSPLDRFYQALLSHAPHKCLQQAAGASHTCFCPTSSLWNEFVLLKVSIV